MAVAQVPPRRRRRGGVTIEERRRILEEEAHHPPSRAPQGGGPPVELVAVVVTAVLALFGVALFLIGKRMAPVESLPYHLGVGIGLVVTAAYVIGVFQFLQRYGEPRTTAAFLLRGVIVLLAAAAASLGTIGMLSVLNVRLDRGTEKISRVLAVSKSKTDRASSVRVVAWWSGDRTLDFDVPDTTYDRVEPRKTYMLVKTRPGAFGWQWVDGTPDVDTSPPAVEATAPAATPSADAAAPTSTDATASLPATGEAADGRAEARALVAKAQQELTGGAPAQGIEDLKRAIDIDPGFTLAYRFLDDALRKQQDYDTIVDYWSKLIDLQPKNVAAWGMRAKARMAKKDLSGALEDAEQACRIGGAACDLAQNLRDQLGR
jgi:hypothetical protein